MTVRVDPFSHNTVLFRGAQTQFEEDDPTFFDVVGASMGYTYDPIIEYVSNAIEFRGREDPTYKPLEDIDGYEAYRDDLMDAKNADHMVELKRAIDENISRREILSKATFGQHFFAGLADPVNLVALPFGGAGIGFARSFLRTGTSVAALQAGQEALRAPFDPLGTNAEIGINIGSAFVAGGLLGTAISIPATRRANAFIKTKDALGERDLIHQPDINTSLPAPTSQRPLSQVENYDIDTVVKNEPRVISKLEEMLDDAQNVLQERKTAFDKATAPEDINVAKTQLDEAQKSVDDLAKDLKARQDNFKLHKDELNARKVDDEAIKNIDKPYNLPKNLWTDSPAYKFVTTPMKRVLQNLKVPDRVKRAVLDIAGDSGILLNLHVNGFRTGPSIYQKASMRDGEWVQVYDELRNIYGSVFGKGKQTVLDYDVGGVTQKLAEKAKIQPKQISFEEYITQLNRKRMLGEKAADDAESRGMKLLDDFYETWEKRLSSTGLVGSLAHYKNKSMLLDNDIEYRQGIVSELRRKKKLTETQEQRLKHNQNILNRLKAQKKDSDLQIKAMSDQRLMPANEEKFHPRYWKFDVIESRREEFFDILFDWYSKNPFVYTVDKDSGALVRTRLSSNPDDISKRVNDTINKILNLDDVTSEANAFYGYGRSKHFRHREVDIPNKLVVDFIENNPIAVMKTYTTKIAPQYEFQAKFGKNIDDVIDDLEDDLLAANINEKQRNAILRDIRHLNDRVQGTVIRNPESMSLKASIILKDLAMLNYLGSAGFATLPDFAKVMMEHELGTVWKVLFGVMNDSRVRMSAQEGRLAGEIIDILKGDAHMRFSENMRNNPLNEGLMSNVRSTFFMLNGVAPMTTIFKKMDAMARGHTLIDMSIKLTKGQATEQEIAYLARYNIGKKEANDIANSPWEQTEAGLYLPNTSKWENKATVENFRTSMNAGIGNTVLMGTPADKPIAVDGVFYVPMHIAKQFGMKQDEKFKGYARIENGLLSMPFQFLSYSLAASNKITASIAQGQVKNRAVAISAAMGLGYMGMELKYKDWQMERMTLDEKIARSFDASGIAALYSDLFYTSMGISMALGGPDIGMGIIKPKFKQDKNMLDAITGIAGAGPSYAVDVGRGLVKFLSGDFGEGSAELIRRLPFAQLHFLKDTTNETARAFAGGRY